MKFRTAVKLFIGVAIASGIFWAGVIWMCLKVTAGL